jgi:Zn ribbon nucleic-acid-binding protein
MKPLEKTHRMPPQMCLRCGHHFDAASGMNDVVAPQPGDLSVCIKCGHAMAFTKRGLRELTKSERRKADKNPHVIKARHAIEEGRRLFPDWRAPDKDGTA